jgi:hypothetical protein
MTRTRVERKTCARLEPYRFWPGAHLKASAPWGQLRGQSRPVIYTMSMTPSASAAMASAAMASAPASARTTRTGKALCFGRDHVVNCGQ